MREPVSLFNVRLSVTIPKAPGGYLTFDRTDNLKTLSIWGYYGYAARVMCELHCCFDKNRY